MLTHAVAGNSLTPSHCPTTGPYGQQLPIDTAVYNYDDHTFLRHITRCDMRHPIGAWLRAAIRRNKWSQVRSWHCHCLAPVMMPATMVCRWCPEGHGASSCCCDCSSITTDYAAGPSCGGFSHADRRWHTDTIHIRWGRQTMASLVMSCTTSHYSLHLARNHACHCSAICCEWPAVGYQADHPAHHCWCHHRHPGAAVCVAAVWHSYGE